MGYPTITSDDAFHSIPIEPAEGRGNQARDALVECREGQSSQSSRFTYEAPHRKPYPFVVGIFRRFLFRGFIAFVFVGTAVWLVVDIIKLTGGQIEKKDLVRDAKLFSVPLVSLLFTWFHVWLALQMMFYPIDFYGIPGRPIVPEWLGLPVNGWQGIVPRKAGIMAQRCCDKMIGNICTIEEFAERVDSEHFWHALQDVFGNVCAEVLQRIIMARWPVLWERLPDTVREELRMKVLEETKNSFIPAIDELKTNINSILDIRQMATDALANDPRLMVDIFRSIAKRELLFITHVAAVMGFLLGGVQVILYVVLEGKWKYTDYIMLPVSGLIIGYFTNWLALKMTFYPIWPHMKCGNYINVQGVFLKRQKEAANQMASAICEKVIDARAMLDYMVKSSVGSLDKIMEIYARHISNSVDQSVGRLGPICPPGVSKQISILKQEVIDFSLELLPKHTREIEHYMDETMDVKKTLSYRLEHISPDEFEDIIHPIFQQDEWILLFVGGFLGVVIGFLQAFALTTIE